MRLAAQAETMMSDVLQKRCDRTGRTTTDGHAPFGRNGGESQALRPIMRKLENWLVLGESERNELQALPCSVLTLSSGESFGARQQQKGAMAIVVTGHMYAYDVLPNGSRHISSFYYPGDLLNYHSFVVGRMLFDYIAVGAVTLCLVDESAFRDFLRKCADLRRVMQLAETARILSLTDRFRAATRLEGEHRMLHLLLEMKAAEELVSDTSPEAMSMPFTQEQLADMMGLTPVYVSKMMTRLERCETIKRDRKKLTLRDRETAERDTGFVNRYRQINDWRVER